MNTEFIFGNSRRFALKWAVLVATSAISIRPAFCSERRFRSNPFQMGIASGAPSEDGFVIWTRLLGLQDKSGEIIPVEWEILDDAPPHATISRGIAQTSAELGFSVHVEPSGLQADRWYRYRFAAGGYQSETGRTRTLPLKSSSPRSLRVAYASCQRWEDGYFSAYSQMLNDAPDFVIFLGDYIYEYASRKGRQAVRTHTLDHIRTLDDFRNRYALYRSDQLIQRMHAACPWLVTWDDHEVDNNYSGNVSVEGTAEFSLLRIAAYQAFYENMPIRRSSALGGLKGILEGRPLRVYGSFDFGRLVRINLLDNRQFRSLPECGTKSNRNLLNVCTDEISLQRSMLGNEQERWLAESFSEAKAHKIRWNILAQQTRFSTAIYSRGINGNRSSDTWDGFPETRQRIIDALVQYKVSNPIILGGDIHYSWIARVHADPFDVKSPIVANEFCGTSISSRNNRTQEEVDELQRKNPHCIFTNAVKRGYVLVDFSLDFANIKLMAVDDPLREDSITSVLAEFKVSNNKQVIKIG